MTWRWGAGPGGGGGGGGGSAARPAQLQTLHSGCLGAWSLFYVGDPFYNIPGTDRSGSGIFLPDSAPVMFDDLVPGEKSGVSQGKNGGPGANYYGIVEMTYIARVRPLFNTAGNSKYITANGNEDIADATGNVAFALWLASGSFLNFFSENGTHVFNNYYPAFPSLIDGGWHFVAARRTAAGVVTLNQDGLVATSGAIPPPTGGSSGRFRCGTAPGLGAARDFIGQTADHAFYNRRLTDAEIAQARYEMMGG